MGDKQYDLFATALGNPNATALDFEASGFTADNSYIQDYSVYRDNDWVRDKFKDANGNFNENALKEAYKGAITLYNTIANNSFNDLYKERVEASAIYDKDDILAPINQRRVGPQFQEVKMSNPYRQIYGLSKIGQVEEPTMSMDEVALTNKVLTNPETAGNNLENAIWEESPNNHFWKYFWDILVLSLYDHDGQHQDPITKEIVQHKKGDLRTNENGEFFYEKLNGRSIYGRQVLNKANILTVDGSKWNRYDIFDSDNLKLKNPVKTLLMNTALVGSMFLGGGIGTWVTGLTLASLLVGLAGVLGKMASSSDNPILSTMEGWSASWDRRRAKSEYAQLHPWCWESLIDMIGDFIEIPRTQRFIFEKVPYIVKGGDYISQKSIEAKIKELAQTQATLNNAKVLQLIANPKETGNLATKIKDLSDFNVINTIAELKISEITKSAQKIGAIFSKGYMALSIGSNMYGEAKAAGASDIDATMLTLGYMSGLYAFLNARVSQWVFPELRAEGYLNKAIAKALIGADERLEEAMTKLTPKIAKQNHAKRLFNIGKGFVNGDYANGTRTLQATIASGVGMGVEGMGFEFLSDLSKGCYDVVKWLQGEDQRMETFGYDFNTNEWNIRETVSQYGETFLSALVGGSIANTFETYKGMRRIGKIDSKLAASQLVYMIRNGQISDFTKALNKMTLGNKNLSFKTEEVNGNLVFKQGTKTDNLDLFIKNRILNQIELWDNMLNAENAKISDDSLLDILTLKDLRYVKLQKSIMRDAYLNEYNTIERDLLLTEAEYNDLLNTVADTNGDGTVTDRESRNAGRTIEERKARLDETARKQADRLEKKIKELRGKSRDFQNNKKAYDYIKDSMFDMNEIISNYIANTSFPLFVRYNYGKEYDKLSDSDKQEALEKYENWKEIDGKERIRVLSDNFYDMLVNLREVLKENGDTYRRTENSILKARNFIKSVSDLYSQPIYAPDSETITLGLDIENTRLGNMNSFITVSFGDSEKAIEYLKGLRLIEGASREKELTKEQLEKINKEASKFINNIAEDAIRENFISVFKDLGYIPTELKNELLLYLNLSIDRLAYLGINDESDMLLFQALIDSRNIVNSLDESPLWKNINKFIAAIDKDNPSEKITITNIFETANNLYNLTLSNIAQFKLSDVLQDLLLSALNILRMYRTAIEASRKDNIDSENAFGYAVTLNEIAKKMDLFDENHKELAEIDSDIVDKLINDININANKIEYLLKLHSINEGQKLSTHDRVATKTKGIIYNRLQRFVNMDNNPIADWEGFNEFKATINSLVLSLEVVNSKLALLSGDHNKEFEQERIKQEDAIFDFFNKNMDKIQDIKELSKLINPRIFNIYEKPDDLLDDDVTALSDNSIIWYLCSRAAVKSSNFYSKFGQIIATDKDKPIAPVFMQELAVYLNYASIVNGEMFNNFYKAYQYSLREDWKKRSPDEKVKILLNLGTTIEEYDAAFDRYWFNFLPVPKYTNITLVEGMPGTGKSAGVLPQTIELLRKFHSEILKNAFVIYGDNIDNARNLLKNLDLEDGVAFGINEFMRQYVTNYEKFSTDVIDSDSFTDDDTYGITPKLEVKTPTANVPKLIIVDEIQRLNVAEVMAIQKFAKILGVRVLGSGDFEQSGVAKEFGIKLNEKADASNLSLNVENFEFARVPKLGLSMRTDNVIKTRNINAIRSLFRGNEEITLSYYSDDTGLYGDRVIHVSPDDISQMSKYEWSETFINTVDQMVNTLPEGEKIGFVYSDPNSSLVKILLSKYKPGDDCPIDYLTKSAAAGQEASYYIIDLLSETSPNNNVLKDINTGISRSSKGSLLILREGLYNIKEQEATSKIDEPKNKNSIFKYASERKKLLKELFPEAITTEKIKSEKKTKTSPTGKTNKDDKLKEDDDKYKPIQDGIANGTDNSGTDSDEETSNRLMQLNESILKLKGARFDVDDDGNIYMMLFTDNTHALGVLVDGDSIKLSSSFESRVDGANGFLKLVKSDKAVEGRLTLNDLDKYLDSFQKILCYTEDKSKLVQLIKKAICAMNSDFEDDDFFVNFGYKQCIQVEGKSTPFSRSANEKVRFGTSGDDEVNSKMVVAVIGTKTKGVILEIPLFVLSSPYTIMGNNKYYSEVNKVFIDAVNSTTGGMEDGRITSRGISAGLSAVIKKFDGNPKYQQLIDLFKIYNIKKSNFTYIIDQVGNNTRGTLSKDQYNKWLEAKKSGKTLPEISRLINEALDQSTWTPAKNLDLLGGRLVKARGAFQLNGKHIVNATNQQINISDLAKSLKFKVSERVYTVSNDFLDKNGNVIVKKGNSFILVSSAPDIESDEDMWNNFINYYNDKEGVKRKVELLYVTPPKASVEEYFNNLLKVYAQNEAELRLNPPKKIGTLFTSYRILKTLLIDNEGKLDYHAIESMLERLKTVFTSDAESILTELENLSKIEKEQGVNRVAELLLTTQTHKLLRKEHSTTLSSKFNFILFHLAEDLKNLGGSFNERYSQNEATLRYMKEYFPEGIYYNLVSDTEAKDKFNQNVFPILADKNYEVDGKPIKVSGIFSNSAFGGNLSKFIKTCLDCGTNIELTTKDGKKVNIFTSPDQEHYTNSIRMWLNPHERSSKKPDEKPSEKPSEKSPVDFSKGLDIGEQSFDILNDENIKGILGESPLELIELRDMEDKVINPKELESLTDEDSGKCEFKVIINGRELIFTTYPEDVDKCYEIEVRDPKDPCLLFTITN